MTTGTDTRIDVRLLREADVEPAEEMSSTAMDAMDRAFGLAVLERDAARIAWAHGRIRHIAATDPEGSVVAERDGEIVGVGLAVRRGSLWFLSLLAVRGDLQGTGIGRRLLDATLDHGRDCPLGMIGASPDPRALRRYARAGFELYPAYSAEGVPDLAGAPAGLGVREGDWERDRELFETLVAERRGEPYGPDLDFLGRPVSRLLVRDGPTPGDRAVCLLRRGKSAMAAAASDDAARRCSGPRSPRRPARWCCPTSRANQQWAIEIAIAARLTLKLGDTLCVKGMAPPAPYLATGVLG